MKTFPVQTCTHLGIKHAPVVLHASQPQLSCFRQKYQYDKFPTAVSDVYEVDCGSCKDFITVVIKGGDEKIMKKERSDAMR